jgi:hypothetical protein
MEILKSKTFWAALAAIVGAGGGYAEGAIDLGAALQTVVTGLIGLFLRFGLAKLGDRIGAVESSALVAPGQVKAAVKDAMAEERARAPRTMPKAGDA